MYNNNDMSKIHWSSPSAVNLFNYQILPCSFAALYITAEAFSYLLKVRQRMRYANVQNPHPQSHQLILVRMTVYIDTIVRIFTFMCYPIFKM